LWLINSLDYTARPPASSSVPIVKKKAYSYIRFSSPEQAKGDSLRRQVDASEAYAKEHGLDLDTSLTFHDLGVSAFKGKNRDEGALRQFIDAVDAGRVKKGSWLLVESLDRISRDDILSALGLFTELLRKGLTIVTLSDRKTYTQKAIAANPMDLMLSLLIFSRANEESAMKGKRVAAAWANKQKEAARTGKPTSRRCPAWLQLSADRNTYEVVPERAEVVKRVYELASSASLGTTAILRRLNGEGVPTFGGGKLWASSSLTKLLTNRSTIGEYQPTTLQNGERVAAGNPVSGFYPAVISPELYDAVQLARASRRIDSRGRKGKAFSNIFTGLAKCPSCGASLRYVDKGTSSGRSAQRYLLCSSALSSREAECGYTCFQYDVLEAALLASLAELDFAAIIRGSQPEHAGQTEALRTRVAVLEGKQQEEHRKTQNLVAALAEGGTAVAALVSAAEASEKRASRLADEVEETRTLLAAHMASSERAQQTATDFLSAYASMRSIDDPERLYQLRAKLNHLLKSLLAELTVCDWPHGLGLEAFLPVDYPNFFKPHGRGATVLCVRYRLRDDVLQLKARSVLVNVRTNEFVCLTEEVGPKELPVLVDEYERMPQVILDELGVTSFDLRALATTPEQLEQQDLADALLHATYSRSFYHTLEPSQYFVEVKHGRL
jgi:DNA invertase Pin-like site-specific DNA recombinase